MPVARLVGELEKLGELELEALALRTLLEVAVPLLVRLEPVLIADVLEVVSDDSIVLEATGLELVVDSELVVLTLAMVVFKTEAVDFEIVDSMFAVAGALRVVSEVSLLVVEMMELAVKLLVLDSEEPVSTELLLVSVVL